MDTSIENTGTFYLGDLWDWDKNQRDRQHPFLYDSKDLTRHAVCIGMTGSGKTGLCLGLLEEALLDSIPVIAIDPKGDIANLLLNFPTLQGTDLLPFLDDLNVPPNEKQIQADARAAQWNAGLEDWGQSQARRNRLKNAADVAIYSPGHDFAIPVSLFTSFKYPDQLDSLDQQHYLDQLSTSILSFLKLSGQAQNKYHVFLCHVIAHLWKRKNTFNLEQLIREVQSPSLQQIGAMTLDAYIDSAERNQLALSLNTLIASPTFNIWMQGETLDIDRLLWSKEGKPKASIFSIAHLDDEKRMFFVTRVLEEIISWMRQQSGSGSLKAILYMDEIFGFLPPVENPPSKKAFLTLLKQARAYGLGLVLASQNPADLDYKALSNTGTWFIGRLQTDRDKQKVMEGLSKVNGSATPSPSELSEAISQLPKRVFLVRNVHDEQLVSVNTRWVMSYMTGPMTAQVLKTFKVALPSAKPTAYAEGPVQQGVPAVSGPPIINSDLEQGFVLPQKFIAPGKTVSFFPSVWAVADCQFKDAQKGLLAKVTQSIRVSGPAEQRLYSWTPLEPEVNSGLPEFGAFRSENIGDYALQTDAWKKLCVQALSERQFEAFYCAVLKQTSAIGQGIESFLSGIMPQLRQTRDMELENCREKYAKQFESIEKKLAQVETRLDREENQYQTAKTQNWVNLGGAILTAFMGRKRLSAGSVGKLGTTLRGLNRSAKEKRDIALVSEEKDRLLHERDALNQRLQQDLSAIELKPSQRYVEKVSFQPKKSDISVRAVKFVWMPFLETDQGFTPLT